MAQMNQKKITAKMKPDTVEPYCNYIYNKIPMVEKSNHPRFKKGCRMDWGFVQVALQDGYDVEIKA